LDYANPRVCREEGRGRMIQQNRPYASGSHPGRVAFILV
jgi:hypothetical protein